MLTRTAGGYDCPTMDVLWLVILVEDFYGFNALLTPSSANHTLGTNESD